MSMSEAETKAAKSLGLSEYSFRALQASAKAERSMTPLEIEAAEAVGLTPERYCQLRDEPGLVGDNLHAEQARILRLTANATPLLDKDRDRLLAMADMVEAGDLDSDEDDMEGDEE